MGTPAHHPNLTDSLAPPRGARPDDSPLAVYGVRDATMANWVMEENCSFIVKPVVWTKDHGKKVYWGDTVVCTPDGAQRLGTRPASIIEIE